MTATILRGNALNLPLADASVDLIVTSPPYFALRSYTDAGEHYAGQIGSEATPGEFVDALIGATREMVRVLKPPGSIWVNLGDKYAGGGGQWDKDERPDPGRRRAVSGKIGTGGALYGLRPKSLIGIPWRYALRCIDDLGLILRAEVIWSKPNGLPESVTDRVRRSHEVWFHFVTQPRYYSAVDEIRDSYAPASVASYARGGLRMSVGDGLHPSKSQGGRQRIDGDEESWRGNPLGKLPGSVWSIPTQPLQAPAHLGVDHFAAFPMEWPRRIIRGWSPPGICVECGEGRRPVMRSTHLRPAGDWNPSREVENRPVGSARPTFSGSITGYACGCPEPTAPTRQAVVLDPFGGTGTTALVAHALGRCGISVDMSGDYCRLARWRTTDPGQVAAAMQVEKPPSADHGTDDLLTLLDGEAS